MRTGSHTLWKLTLASAIAVGLILMGGQAFAAVPISITQQGRLLDGEGTPMSGSVELDFALYDAESDGTILWSDTLSTSLDDNGVYSVKLGDSAQPIDSELLMDGEVFLSLTVDGEELSPRLEMTSVPFASLASAAEVAHSVADGAITSNALASGAVTSESIDSVGWDQITDIPSEVTETSDTLAGLSCSSDEVALYNGSEWGCSALPEGASYTAGTGLDLSGNQFSADTSYFNSNYLQDGGDINVNNISAGGDAELDGDLRINSDMSENLSYIRFRDSAGSSGPRFFHAEGLNLFELNGTDRFNVGMDLDVNGDVTTGGNVNVDGEVTTTGNAEFDGNIRVNSDLSDNISYIRFRDADTSTGPRLFHRESVNRFRLRGADEFNVDMDLDVNGSVSQTSDERLKEDVENLENVLDEVLALQPTRYRMKHWPEEREKKTYGFMAQEVERIFPEAVRYDEDDDQYGLIYSAFSVLAVQAIQEQQAIIDEQAHRIDSQDRRIDEQAHQIDELEQRLERLETAIR